MATSSLSEDGEGVGGRTPGAGGSISAAQQVIASSTGAMLTSLLVTPLDVVKIRLQAQKQPMKKGSPFIYCNGLMDHLCICQNGNQGNNKYLTSMKNWYCRPGRFTGTVDAFVKIARMEGIASLWSGLPPTLVMAVPATVVYFTAFDALKYSMGYNEKERSTQYIPMAAGALARIGAATLISPIEMVRTKMQSEYLSYSQIGIAVRSSMKQTGILSLWRGLGPTLLRDVPFSAIYWFSYERLKAEQMRKSGEQRVQFYQSFLAGAIAGTVAGVLTLPFDVVKTHRQMTLGDISTKTERKATFRIILALYHQGGATSLFAGIVPRIMRIAPACAIMISTYEFFKTFFRDYNAGQENMTSQQHDVTSNHSQTSVADSAFSKSER